MVGTLLTESKCKLYYRKICYIWHPNNRFVFQWGIYNVLYRINIDIVLLYNMLCNTFRYINVLHINNYITCYIAYNTKVWFFTIERNILYQNGYTA